MNKMESPIFDNVIVSDCNREAYKICLSFLDSPHGKFISLFGPTASGKIYLLTELQKAYRSKYANAKIRTTTFEELISKIFQMYLQ